MKALVVHRYKTEGGMSLTDVPAPEVGPRDVLVEVRAAGVNPLDSKIQQGEFKLILPYETPFVLGHDVAGEVVEIGAAVTRFAVGDEVFARPGRDRIGTFAELIAIDEADVARKPASLTMEEAASLPLVALTAWQALVEVADVQPGQKVLIHAGSGGVGSIAIQLAKHLGASVATTVGTANVEWARALGADVVVDYRTEDFEQVVSGYDVALVSQDAETLEKSMRVLKPGGIAISLSGPPDPEFADTIGAGLPVRIAMRLLSRRARRRARALGVRYAFLFMRAEGTQLEQIGRLVEEGVIRPVVDRVLGFDEILQALAYVDTGRVKGKVVVTIP